MIQIYFLSILFNLIAGLALISKEDKDTEDISIFRLEISLRGLKDKKFRFFLGILAMAAGILKLLSPIEGNILFLGDLVPAAAGIVSGFILVFENYGTSTIENNEEKETIGLIIFRNKKIIGFAAIAAAVLHFLFPRIIFL